MPTNRFYPGVDPHYKNNRSSSSGGLALAQACTVIQTSEVSPNGDNVQDFRSLFTPSACAAQEFGHFAPIYDK